MATRLFTLVRLREVLSSNDTAFAKLVRHELPATTTNSKSLQTTTVEVRPYRMNRKLSAEDLKIVIELYEAGESMVELAKKFECHRQTIARQLKKAGVEPREQQVRSPAFDARARTLYEQGNSLDEVANMLGVQASTINRAVRGAGGDIRPQRNQPRLGNLGLSRPGGSS